MRAGALATAALAATLVGCTAFHAVETTPEAMARLEPADTVRITTRDGEQMTLRIWFVTDEHIAGRVDGGHSETLHVRLDRIATIEVERLNLRKTLLGTVLPAVIAAAIACEQRDCRTTTALTTRY